MPKIAGLILLKKRKMAKMAKKLKKLKKKQLVQAFLIAAQPKKIQTKKIKLKIMKQMNESNFES